MKTLIIKILLTVVFANALTFLVSANNSKAYSHLENTVHIKMNVLESDEELSIEEWMVDDQAWSIEQEIVLNDTLEYEESNLLIEDWMTNDEYFKFNCVENKNVQIIIEEWMIDDELWRF